MTSPKHALLSLFALLCYSCGQREPETNDYAPRVIGITVSDMEQSMNWYTSHLHFERDTVMHFPDYGITVGMIHQGDFYLELVTFSYSLARSELSVPPPYTEIDGFFKLGFQAEDIEALYNELASNGSVQIIVPLNTLPGLDADYDWPDQYFMVADPDGNYVQFFSKKHGQSRLNTHVAPFLIALSSADIDASTRWYQKYLGARLIDKVGQKGNERVILDKDGFVIELGEFADYIPFDSLNVPDSLSLFRVHGIRKLSFLVQDIQQVYHEFKDSGIPFDFDLTEQKSLVSDRYFMLRDTSGNSLQFLEVDR